MSIQFLIGVASIAVVVAFVLSTLIGFVLDLIVYIRTKKWPHDGIDF